MTTTRWKDHNDTTTDHTARWRDKAAAARRTTTMKGRRATATRRGGGTQGRSPTPFWWPVLLVQGESRSRDSGAVVLTGGGRQGARGQCPVPGLTHQRARGFGVRTATSAGFCPTWRAIGTSSQTACFGGQASPQQAAWPLPSWMSRPRSRFWQTVCELHHLRQCPEEECVQGL